MTGLELVGLEGLTARDWRGSSSMRRCDITTTMIELDTPVATVPC